MLVQIIVFIDFPWGSDGKESVCNVEDLGSIPESERSPGEGRGNHSSILAWRIPMDKGAWWATVVGVEKSWTKHTAHSVYWSSQVA